MKCALPRRRRAFPVSLIAFLLLCLAIPPVRAQEVEVTGPLKGAPAVRHLRLYREGRFEIAPTLSFTLLNQYRHTLLAGGRLGYSVFDWLTLGVWGGYAVLNAPTSLSAKINEQAPNNLQTQAHIAQEAQGGFLSQTATINWLIAPQVTFVPFRGKIALFESFFVDTDVYIHAGLAGIGLRERGACGGGTEFVACTDPESFALLPRMTVAPTFGIGFSAYLSEFVSLGFEYRALPFRWNAAGFASSQLFREGNQVTAQLGPSDRDWRLQQMLTLSLGFSFPTMPRIGE